MDDQQEQPTVEHDQDTVFSFDMERHAMVIAFPYCTVVGTEQEFVGPPRFITNMPEDRDPSAQIEAALLFALTTVRAGKVTAYPDAPNDLSTLKEGQQ